MKIIGTVFLILFVLYLSYKMCQSFLSAGIATHAFGPQSSRAKGWVWLGVAFYCAVAASFTFLGVLMS